MSRPKSKDARKQLRISAELKERAEEYCKRTHQSFSAVTTRFWVRLLDEDELRRTTPTDAKQI